MSQKTKVMLRKAVFIVLLLTSIISTLSAVESSVLYKDLWEQHQGLQDRYWSLQQYVLKNTPS